MKKYLLLSAFLIAGTDELPAQGFYLKGGVGYAFPLAGQTLSGYGQPFNGSVANDINYKMKGVSFSAGTYLNASFGYMFNSQIGVELAASAGVGTQTYTYTDNNANIGSVPSDATILLSAKLPVFVSPSVVLQSGGSKVNIYSRMGIAIPFHANVTREATYENHPGTGAKTVRVETWQQKTSFSLGLSGALGVEYHVTPQLSIWGEASFLSASRYLAEESLQSFVYNGQNISVSQLAGTTSYKYGKNITIDTATNSPLPSYSLPFSNIGINAGVKYILKTHSRNTHNEMERREQL